MTPPSSPERRRWISAAAVTAMLPGWPVSPALAAEADTPPGKPTASTSEAAISASLDLFFSQPTIHSASLSPDGRHLAMVGTGDRRPVALVQELATQKTIAVMPNASERPFWRSGALGDVVDLTWIDTDLLIVRMTRSTSMVLRPSSELVATLKGTFVEQLPDQPDGKKSVLSIHDDVMHWVDVPDGEQVEIIPLLPATPRHWAFDAKGRLRAATTVKSSGADEPVWTQWYLPPGAKAKWQQLEQTTDFEAVWQPLRVLDDGEIVVRARTGRDTFAVFRYDPNRRQLGELMAGHPTEDFLGKERLDMGGYDSAVTGGLRRQEYWFDERRTRLQKAVDQALPGKLNRLIGKRDAAHVLVHSRSDVDPGRWYSLDTTGMVIAPVGVARPDINPGHMRPVTAYRYPARDGLNIPAYLTRPRSDGPAPTVVLLRGNPIHRDDWGWDAEVQWLAAQGFAVFQPQVRGSFGFGRAYQAAGYGQWGRAMQDDITDGVQQLIARGIADPARIAIVGSSYGGYAAMWGLATTPKLYRCGISLSGISDPVEFLRTTRTKETPPDVLALRRRLMGDPSVDAAALRAVAPITQVDRIEAPLLLAHPIEDRIVPRDQSETMVRALTALGKRVEWLPLNGDHVPTVAEESQQRLYRQRMLAFLNRHLAAKAD
ncbi:alpha/beta fold hydrolase [Roseateles sp.]|uniref:alpha/beta hydrolase family protein n=1 Tax=Roseateles sp. TaxID=1971397 RepID=UPI0031DD0C14